MKMTGLSTLVFASILALGGLAQARGGGSGVLFDVNLYYGSSKEDQKLTDGTESKSGSTTAIYDIKLGYLGGSGLYLGGIYTSHSSTPLDGSGTNGSAMGGSVGYFGSTGFFIMGHYLVTGTYGKYTDGSGMQVDLGYKAGVGGNWLVGGELSYRSMTYKKNEDIANLDSYTSTDIVPMVSIGYMF
jgi:hypothetical protein